MLISKFDNTNIEQNILAFEKKYSFHFPISYRNFLLKYNGDATPNTSFKVNKVSSGLSGFYGLGNASESFNYSRFDQADILRGYLDDGMIPIGSNIFGDSILMGIGEKNGGKIYFLYHDRPKNYLEIASHLKSFVEQCKSKKIGHIKTIEERKETLIANGYGDELESHLPYWQEEIDYYSTIHQEELVLD